MWFLSLIVVLYPCGASERGDFDVVIRNYSWNQIHNVVVHEHAQCFLHNPINGAAHPIYTALFDQMLEGYRFFPEIDVTQGGPKLLCSEVRDRICTKVPFFSEAMEHYISELGHFLARNGYLKNISAEAFYNLSFPRGQTRRCFIVSKDDVKQRPFQDQVFIMFSQEKEVLKGVLCDRGCSTKRAHGESLLDFKLLWQQPCGCKSPGGVLGSSVLDAFTLDLEQCPSGCGIGVVLFSEDGTQKKALFDTSRYDPINPVVFPCKDVSFSARISPISYFRLRILTGFVFRCRMKGLIDVESFYDPGVREAVCYREAFSSPAHVSDVIKLVNSAPRVQLTPLKENDPELKVADIQQLLDDGAFTFQWTLVDKGELSRCLALDKENAPWSCIFVALQKESLILRGDVVPTTNYAFLGFAPQKKNSLLQAWTEALFAEAGRRALTTQGFYQVVGKKDLRFVPDCADQQLHHLRRMPLWRLPIPLRKYGAAR